MPKIEAFVMPEERIEKTLDDIEVGESFWTVPWNIQVAADNTCYMSRGISAEDKDGGGTHELFVTKKEHGVACILYGDEKFDRDNSALKLGSYPVLSLEFKPERDRRSR
jgi:hypothetical protein